MQKIKIENLGPVKDFEMEIKKFNLLIGEQATGKSTIAKCVYFFRTIKTHLTYYFQSVYDSGSYFGHDISDGFQKVLKTDLKSIFISLFGFSWELDNELYLNYSFANNKWINVQLKKNVNSKRQKYISISFSPILRKELFKLEKEVNDLYTKKKSPIGISLDYTRQERLKEHNRIKVKLDTIFDDNFETYYIPAGRSMITLLSSNRAGINIENLDLVTRQFMQLIESIQGSFSNGITNAHKYYPSGNRSFDTSLLTNKIIQNLKGDYQYNQGKEYLVVENEHISINFTSSGQQEILWLFNLLYILMLKKENAFVIIEEPEAHLYPDLQQEVINFISFFSNINNSSVLLTTHSPYVLTATNVYYYAGKILQAFENIPKTDKEKLEKEIYKIIERKREISPNEFSAFKLKKDHIAQSLIHEEYDEIAGELIDETSDKTNSMYMDLFYLEEKYSNKGGE